HTALKVAPAYPSGSVLQVHDASQGVLAANAILNPKTRAAFRTEVEAAYARIRVESDLKASRTETLPLADVRNNALKTDWRRNFGHPDKFRKITDFPHLDLNAVRERIDWREFRRIWQDAPDGGSDLRKDAENMLDRMIRENAVTLSASLGFFPACSQDDSLCFLAPEGKTVLPMLRQQFRKYPGQPNLALSDYFPPEGGPLVWGGCFAVGCSVDESFLKIVNSDDYNSLLVKTLADRLAEAGAGLLQEYVRQDWQGAEKISIIRPAPGYPAVPDHALKADIFRMLDVERKYGFRLTESYMMIPASAVCGFLIVHPNAQYFAVGRIGEDQLADYARRRCGDIADVSRFIAWQERT
ncbi:MAG: hypothetical protein J5858_12705, partial [Lentisphaeria bacterium]|nr:hypothetical protein [Lentisphaeria bacterium]